MRIRQMLDSSDPAEAARAAVIAAKSILSTGTNASPEVIARARQLVAMGEAELARQIRARRLRTPPQSGAASTTPSTNPAAYDKLFEAPGEQPEPEQPVGSLASTAPQSIREVAPHEMTFRDDDLILEIALQSDDARGPLRNVDVDVRGAHIVVSAIDALGYRVARRVDFERKVPPMAAQGSAHRSLVELRLKSFKNWAGLHPLVGLGPITVGGESMVRQLHEQPEWRTVLESAAPRPVANAPRRAAAPRTDPAGGSAVRSSPGAPAGAATPPTGFPAFGAPQAAPTAPPQAAPTAPPQAAPTAPPQAAPTAPPQAAPSRSERDYPEFDK